MWYIWCRPTGLTRMIRIFEIYSKNTVMKNSMKRSETPVARPEATTLDLPDWSGMDGSPDRVSPATAFRLSEEYRQWLPKGNADLIRREKCPVEFVL